MNVEHVRFTTLAFATALALGGCAATPEPLEVVDDADVVALDEFASRPTDGLWNADRLIGLPVRNADGEEIGEVENLVVGPDDRLLAMIVSAGGILDVGDALLRVPWSEVDVDPSAELEYATVPIDGDDLERYDAAGGPKEDGERREWRVDELIGDYVTLDDTGAADYGTVRDVVFDADGELESVVVNRSARYGGGYYNFPYYGYGGPYGFEPGLYDYSLGYGTTDLVGYGPFTYDGFGLY